MDSWYPPLGEPPDPAAMHAMGDVNDGYMTNNGGEFGCAAAQP